MSRRRASRYSRLRQKGAYFTRNDAKAWRRLIREARICAENLDDPGGDFAKAAEAASPCCFPWPVIKGKESGTAFVYLIGLGRRWPDLDIPGRHDVAGELDACIATTLRILGPPPPPATPPPDPPARPFRADIDG